MYTIYIYVHYICIYTCQGGKDYLMRAHFGLPSVENDETEGKPPIRVKFEIPYFTVSGIQVLYPLLRPTFYMIIILYSSVFNDIINSV